MKIFLTTATIFLLHTAAVIAVNNSISPEQKQHAMHWIRAQPVKFHENKGQMTDMEGNPVPFVLFKAEAPGMDMYVTEKGLTYVFVKTEKNEYENADGSEPANEGNEGNEKDENIRIEWNRIDMELKRASIKKENIITEGKSINFSQYFFSHCPDGISDVHSYEKITIRNIYPNIDWVLYNSEKKGFKYDFIVHPGADPKQIKLLYRSKENLHIDNEGNIEIRTSLGKLTENTPYSYIQETGKVIESIYAITHTEKIHGGGFETAVQFHLNTQYLILNTTLIIDPQLQWGTYYGGNSYDGFCSVKSDGSNNVFVTGYTSSSNFPTLNPLSGAYFNGIFIGSGSDVFLIKFSNTGVLLWATYYGGSANDIGASMDIDAGGNVFVTGRTNSSDFPTFNPLNGAYFQGLNAGAFDVFLLQFSNSGALLWATYYGGSDVEWGNSLALDNTGNVFVTGWTQSINFPMKNPGSGAYFYGGIAGGWDVFILKLSNIGSLLWATNYGGTGDDWGYSLAIDGNDNVFMTGVTQSINFPTQDLGGGAYFQAANAGNGDAFILKFSNTGARLWATYYGASGGDYGFSLATDGNDNLFVTGQTGSPALPLVDPGGGAYFQAIRAGSWEVFLLKFDPTGVLSWATYYGGSGSDYFQGISMDHEIVTGVSGNIFVTGWTNSNDFPTKNPGSGAYFQGSKAGSMDVFLLEFSNNLSLLWATYSGTDSLDMGTALDIDQNGCLIAVGEWVKSGSNGLMNPGGSYYDDTWNGSDDSYIMKFCSCTVPTATVSSTAASCSNIGTATVNASGGTSPYTYLWSSAGQTTSTATGLFAGTYTVTLFEAGGCSQLFTVTVSASGIQTVSLQSQTNVLCNGDSTGTATVGVSGGTSPYTYSWNNGQTTSSVSGLAAGNYTITVIDFLGCISTQTVDINEPASLTATATSTSASCGNINGTATVNAVGGTSGYIYIWNNGQTISAITGLGTGNYTVAVTDANGCSSTQTVTVASSGNSVTTSQSASICSGDSIFLQGVYQTTAGIYSDTITSTGACDSIIATTLTINPKPSVAAFSNITITQGQSVTLTASGGGSYSWSNGINGSSITVTPLVTTVYCVTVTDANNCTDTACVTVTIEPIDCSNTGELYLPNAFSPNNDGENEVIKIYYGDIKCIKIFKLVIYNRWGEKVFVSVDPYANWDGKYRGKELNTSVYVYYLEVMLNTGEAIHRKGNISLIR